MKRLATIEIVRDDYADKKDGTSESMRTGPDSWKIILRPNIDKHYMATYDEKTILAHEIGHTISELYNSLGSRANVRNVVGPLPGELEAWHVAKQINPNINYVTMTEALNTYITAYKNPDFAHGLLNLFKDHKEPTSEQLAQFTVPFLLSNQVGPIGSNHVALHSHHLVYWPILVLCEGFAERAADYLTQLILKALVR